MKHSKHISILLSIVISVISWFITNFNLHSKYEREFQNEVQHILDLFKHDIKLYENTLRSLKNTYEINERPLNFVEFKRYNKKLLELLPSSIGVAFYRNVPTNQVSEFEHFMQTKTGTLLPEYSQFKIDPAEIREHNILGQYAFPFENYKNVLGKNILLLPHRKESILYALEYEIALTPVIPLVSSKNTFGMLFLMPVFDIYKYPNLDINHYSNKNFEKLYGIVGIGVNFNKIFNKNNYHDTRVDFKIYDQNSNSEPQLIHNTLENENQIYQPTFSTIKNISIYNRQFRFEFLAQPNFIPLDILILPYGIAIFVFIISILLIKQFRIKQSLQSQKDLLLEAQAVLHENEEQLHIIIDTIPMVFLIARLHDGKILLHNRRTIDVFELTREPEYTTNYYATPEQRLILIEEVQKQKGTVKDFEILFKKENGKTFWGLVSIKSSYYLKEKVLLVMIHDITDRKKTEETLRILATTDSLTGLYNRRHFLVLANEELNLSLIEQKPFAVMMLDIDFFKKINDTYGHDIGDKAIQILALSAKTFLPENSIIGRLGGEEFGVILINTSLNDAIMIANSFREKISFQIVEEPKENISFSYTLSIGVACVRCLECENQSKCNKMIVPHFQNIEDLLKLADIALYRAKQNGRNQVQHSI